MGESRKYCVGGRVDVRMSVGARDMAFVVATGGFTAEGTEGAEILVGVEEDVPRRVCLICRRNRSW